MVFCCVFFFNGLSTTRNYPYVHTLSLHCALPFSSLGAAPVYVLGTRKESTQNVMLAFAAGVMLAATFFSLLLPALDRAEAGLGSRGLAATGVIAALRSEEHTSELQSLMRISYAVFCLQTKQTKNST